MTNNQINSSQGGFVGYEYLLVVVVISVATALFVSKRESDKQKQQIEEIKKEVDAMSESIGSIETSIKLISENVRTKYDSSTREIKEIKDSLSTVRSDITTKATELDNFQTHLAEVRDDQMRLREKVATLPGVVDGFIKARSQPMVIEIPDIKTVSVSRIVRKKGKTYQQTVMKHKKMDKDPAKKKKFNMPAVEKVREQIVEHSL